MKSIFTLFGAAAVLGFSSMSATAQDPHAGHNHQPPPQNYVEAPLPHIDHVLTESPEDHVMGAATAPVTIIAYASVMCPHCAQWFTTEWPVFKENHIDTGQVRFVFREFPTSPVNYARTGFVIANCAPTERYFDHIVYQMQNQNYIFSAIQAGQARPMYQSLAYQAGLQTPEQMQACFAEPDAYQRMDKAMLRARKAGVQSVPGFIIDGQVFKGNSTALNLGQVINARLSQGTTSMPTVSMPSQRRVPARPWPVQRTTPIDGPVSAPSVPPVQPPAPVAEPQKSMMKPLPQAQASAPEVKPEPKPETASETQRETVSEPKVEPVPTPKLRLKPAPETVVKPEVETELSPELAGSKPGTPEK